ncbi:hypothetical protein [Mangrovihabitans endophyticus]|uniref:Secreted protein n=1 Tax=Mangrovihabitans endophyticus TaxID=1751298 RepID=A0A8J3C4W4_9ACTN|nr:hypothetical protein [Mangrovihabitans endophyticus]GGL15400.1 hypothetical protein GCM10012284_57570 [Mangrovihabitans endophyticus]
MHVTRKAALAGGLVVAGTIAGSLIHAVSAQADPESAPPSLVEDYTYPGAAAIEASRHITLVSGDGNITLVECGSQSDLIEVESYNNVSDAVYCFAVRGDHGQLSLEIPKVFFIWAGDESVTATITVAGEEQPPVVVPANDGEAVGAADPKNHAVLLELTV